MPKPESEVRRPSVRVRKSADVSRDYMKRKAGARLKARSSAKVEYDPESEEVKRYQA